MRRIWNAYQVELAKALRQRFTYVGLVLVVIAVLMVPLLHTIEADGESDYEFIAFAAPAALNLIGLLLILTYCAGLVSSELASGTIRLILVRPLYRHEFLAAKMLLGMTYVVALSVLVGLSCWFVVLAFGDALGVMSGGEMAFTGREVFLTYLAGSVAVLFPLWAAVAYAIMVSTLTRSVVAAISTTVGIWFLLDLFKYPLGIAPYLFTTYLETPWQPFRDQVTTAMAPEWWPGMLYCVGTSLVYSAVFMAVGVAVFRRRSLQP